METLQSIFSGQTRAKKKFEKEINQLSKQKDFRKLMKDLLVCCVKEKCSWKVETLVTEYNVIPWETEAFDFVQDIEILKALCAYDRDNSKVLLWAVEIGNLNLVKSIVQNELVDVHKGPGKTALHVAASFGQLEVMKFLLEETDLNPDLSLSGESPLSIAVKQQDFEMVNFLLTHHHESFYDQKTERFRCETLLDLACKQKDSRIIKLILEKTNVDPNQTLNTVGSILWSCVDPQVAITLIEDPRFQLPKHQVSRSLEHFYKLNQTEVVRKIVEKLKKQNPDQRIKCPKGLVERALKSKSPAKKLLVLIDDFQFDPNAGSDPLLHSLLRSPASHLEVCEMLISHPSVDVSLPRRDGATPLHIASSHGPYLVVLLMHRIFEQYKQTKQPFLSQN